MTKKDEKGFSLAAERLYPVYERIGGRQGIRHPRNLAEDYVKWMDNYTKNYKSPPHGGNYCNVDNIKRFEQEWFS